MADTMLIPENVPACLRERPQWVVWRYEKRHGRETKVPYCPKSGRRASSADPSTWTSFTDAVAAYARGGYDGIGYVFLTDDPFCGIDLDDCVDEEGHTAPWAQEILGPFRTYTEISPSGCGIKVFLRGRKPDFAACEVRGFGPDGKGGIEVYDRARYFTLTGRALSGAPSEVADCQAELDALCRRIWPEQEQKQSDLEGVFTRQEASPGFAAVSDQERFDRCLAAMLRMNMEDNKDGSKRLFAAACRCVEHDLSDDQAVACIRAYAEQKPFPVAWSDADILKRIRSAERRCIRGDAIEGEGRPAVLLPGGPVPISEAAAKLGRLLAATGKYYVRGATMVSLETDPDGDVALKIVKPAALASLFESVAKLKKFAKVDGEFVEVDATCTEQAAKLIQHADPFLGPLPAIRLLTPCPVLVERDGRLLQVCGYDRPSGILAAGEPAPEGPLKEAKALLSEVLADFRFASPPDRARALAAMITPALVFGGHLGGRAPIDLGEADQSQTGKGFRNKLIAAVYGSDVRTVTQRRGGVGSMEESFCTALVQGRVFISFDNVRGRIDSPAIESFLTEDTYLARVPYQGSVEIDPRRVVVQMTSNKADITIDLANRCSCVRILKQEPGYRFREYPEGDALDHVRANQPLYLGAVFAVVRAWHATGKPRSRETRHDFRPWSQTLDWIVQNLLDAGPLLDGHRETQVRMATPVLNWLRDVAMAVRQAGRLGVWLRASNLVEIIADNPTVEVPGLSDDGDLSEEPVRKKVLQAMGRKLALCFKAGDRVTIDDLKIERVTEHDEALRRDIRTYRFGGAPIESPRIGAESPSIGADEAGNTPEAGSPGGAAPMEPPICAYGAPMAAPNGQPCAPNAPIGPVQGEHFEEIPPERGKYSEYRPPIGAIGAIGAEETPEVSEAHEPDSEWELI